MMARHNFCVAIPEELNSYLKIIKDLDDEVNLNTKIDNFGVRIINNPDGQIDHVSYYSHSGDLVKEIFYKGSVMAHILHYRSGLLCIREDFEEGRVSKKINYDEHGNIKFCVTFTYDRNEHIKSIKKSSYRNTYQIDYGFDELDRVNRRTIIVNNIVMNEQYYRYDIRDRIVMYRDNFQTVTIQEVGSNNELIRYVVQDKLLNNLIVYNKYSNNEYIESELTLNGHKMCTVNKYYADNAMLRKPYTREDDLDFMMANIFGQNFTPEKSKEKTLPEKFRINNNMHVTLLPISIRKSTLLVSRTAF